MNRGTNRVQEDIYATSSSGNYYSQPTGSTNSTSGRAGKGNDYAQPTHPREIEVNGAVYSLAQNVRSSGAATATEETSTDVVYDLAANYPSGVVDTHV